ncbi:hypothetical protein ACHQM5_007288 [Ranunculus cassubicifolius]
MAHTDIPPQKLIVENKKQNPSKFNSHFLYKALSVAIVLVVLPLFPSQAPDFVNQTIFTRSWELLHLLFVGIAVSYGLFSRRNVETEKENQLKIDTTQTYMSRILQVSSVFDDEVETPVVSDESNTQTWSSKYLRGNPVVVEEESPALDQHSATITNIRSKPLFLPVRSLRSSVSDSDSVESVGESIDSLGSKGGSSGRFDRARTRDFDNLDDLDLEEKLKESVVLPSPIPWRSRSGRLEMKEEACDANPPPYSLPPSYNEPEFDQREFRPVHRSSQSNSISPSPKKLSPAPSLSPEMRVKNLEDLGKKKKNFHKSSPPPPPPPPPTMSRKSPSSITNSRSMRDELLSDKKSVNKSFKDELKDLSKSDREEFPKRSDFEMDYLKSEAKRRSQYEASSLGKSVRTIRGSEPIAEDKKYREADERTNGKAEKKSNEVDREFVDKSRRKAGGFNQQFTVPENQNAEISRTTPKPMLPKYHKKEKKRVAQKVILESEEYSSSESDDIRGNSDTEKTASDSFSDSGPDSNEVDKKADEFIAKFREQIRLQRIESIKRSSGQHR